MKNMPNKQTEVAAFMHTEKVFPLLPVDGPRHNKSLRICVVNWEFPGPVSCGGANISVAMVGEALAAAGHQVTFLYTQPKVCTRKTMAHWVESYKARGIDFVPLPEDESVKSPHWLRVPYLVYAWLKDKEFDVLHSVDYRAEAYFACLAKHLGLAFANTLLVTGMHGMTDWSASINYDPMNRVSLLGSDYIERCALAYSDIVIGPSQYILNWFLAHGGKIPEQTTYMQQNITLRPMTKPAALLGAGQLKEIVFFGRLEPRKGYELFCAAISLLPTEILQKLTITFLGSPLEYYGTGDHVEMLAEKWPCKWQILDNKRNHEALHYLSEPGRIAVMPSRGDNSPCVVLECVAAGIPFLTTTVGGIPELIDKEDRDRVCFTPRADILADRLLRAYRGGHAPAKPTVGFDENQQRWLDWHEQLTLPAKVPLHVVFTKENSPLVSICVYARNEGQRLQNTIASIEKLDYPNFAVILVDDGSTDIAATAVLDELEPTFTKRGWKIVRRRGAAGKGASMNAAALCAQGEYLKMMDAGDVAQPDHLSVGVRVAQHVGAEILTSLYDTPAISNSQKKKSPKKGASLNKKIRWLFVGPATAIGALQNCFGSFNALIRRDVFQKLGGYSLSGDVYNIHWEFYSRAALEGHHLDIIPEVLYANDVVDRWPFFTPDNVDNLPQLQPYLDGLTPDHRALVVYASGHARPRNRPRRQRNLWARFVRQGKRILSMFSH